MLLHQESNDSINNLSTINHVDPYNTKNITMINHVGSNHTKYHGYNSFFLTCKTNTILPLSLYDMDIMAVYLNELYNIFARGYDAIVGNRAWQHNKNKKNSIPTKDPCKYMCIYNS